MQSPAIQKLPNVAGIGLRAPHYQEILHHLPQLGWVEVHSENFFAGGAALHTLLKVREHYAVSLHGVGLGLASPAPLNKKYLLDLKNLCAAIQPTLISEHLCWNSIDGEFINDLLPFPYTRLSLQHVAARVEEVQQTLGRQILIENISSYIAFTRSEMSEAEFLAELSNQTKCGILLDVNNLYVNAHNLNVDADAFIKSLPADAVGEYHLAGYSVQENCLIDTHSAKVSDGVWELYQSALQQIGSRPTLIEWDTDLPTLAVLQEEAAHAQFYLDQEHEYLAA